MKKIRRPEDVAVLLRSYLAERFFDEELSPIIKEAVDTIETLMTEKAEAETEQPMPPSEEKSDPVNHPQHYCGKIETIDFIKDKVPDFTSYCVGNCLKYLSRYDKKGKPVEDLEKAEVYLGWAIQDMKERIAPGDR